MCRLLVTTRDHLNGEGQPDVKTFQEGDVIDVCEDGQDFGASFVGHEAFMIIDIPGFPASAYRGRLSRETEDFTDPISGDVSKVQLRKRMFGLNIATLKTQQNANGEVTVSNNDLVFSEKPSLKSGDIL